MSKGTVAGIELAVIEIETDNGSRFGTVALVRGESRHTPEGDGARISFMGSESEVTWPDARLVWPDEPHAVSLPSINATTRMHLELSENLRSQSDRVIVELPRFISGGTPFPVTVFGESDGREFLVGQGLALSKAEGALASDSGTSAFTEEEHPRSRGVLRLAARTDALSASTQLSVSFTGPMSRLQGAWRSHRTATGTRVEARFVNPTHRAVHTLSLWARTAPGIVASSTTVRLSGIGQPVQLPSGQIHRAWNRPQIPVLTPKDSIDLCLEFDSPPGPWLDVLDIRLRSPLGSLSAQRVPGTM